MSKNNLTDVIVVSSNGTLTVQLSSTQVAAFAILNKTGKEMEMLEAAFNARLKGELLRAMNGNIVTGARLGEATHTIKRVSKAGVPTWTSYKGGMRADAAAAYRMAKAFLPADMTEAKFVALNIANISLIISNIEVKDNASASDEDGEEVAGE